MTEPNNQDMMEQLSAYLDGELDEASRADVFARLERDPEAVRLLNEFRETRALLQDLPHAPAPPEVIGHVMAAVHQRASRRQSPPARSPPSSRRRAAARRGAS